jgi:hypothetical protein
MNINTAFQSRYLKATDLNGKTPVVTIDRVELEAVSQDKDKQPVLYFVGKDKGVVLNRTNAQTIMEVAGTPDTDEWNGVQVQLVSVMVDYKGVVGPAIRFRRPPVQRVKPAGKAAKPVVVEEDDFSDIDGSTGTDDAIPF